MNKNIILPTIGSAGDVHPMIALGDTLRERGHQVTIVTNPLHEETVRAAGFAFHPLGTRAQAQAMAGFFTATVGPVLQTLGPGILESRTIELPHDVDSRKSIVAIHANDPAAMGASLDQLSPMMGFERRLFQGDTIWENPGAAITFAGGHLIAGHPNIVEAALRQAVNAQAPRLSDEARFQRAAAFTSPGGVYYGYSDFRVVMELAAWTEENWEQLLREQLRDFEFDDATIDEWIEDERDAREEGDIVSMPPIDVITRHLGDTVSEARMTEDGVIYRSAWLTPR